MVILPEVNLSVHKGKGEIAHIRVSRDRSVLLIRDFVNPVFWLCDLPVYPLYCFRKKLG